MSNGQWKPNRPRRPGADSAWFRGLNLAMSFGITLAVSLWITWKLGTWLDAKLGTNVIFTFALVLIGIVSSFRVFLRELAHFEEEGRKGDE